ncbi:MFS transporter [Streptococcus minor]|uniref:MFS transporter n=1 Tax=Streptococcus minor TaxID=229549 RepID=UPI00036DF169|nr:MFS transporter [Streptococcus minor]
MKQIIEKISILSLSLMLVSTFAVSPALPQMIDYFGRQGYAASQVEFLITITSLFIMISLLANPIFVRFLSDRALVILGLTLMALGGSLPFLFPNYYMVFLSRTLLGLGIGLINARAINIVGLFYQGKERIQMMGLRGSFEVLGSASLTILVGWLSGFGWQTAFLAYLVALIILFLFIRFVPKRELSTEKTSPDRPKLTKDLWKMGLRLAFLAFFVINVNTFTTIRIPLIVTDNQLGTAVQASWILGGMQLMGIISGALFGFLVGRLKEWLLPVAYVAFGLSILIVAFSTNLFLLGVGAMISGFCYSVVLTIVFSQTAEKTPPSLLMAVMTVVLAGCNIGGATASILPNFLESLNPTPTGAFGIYAVGCALISLLLIYQQFSRKKSL